MVESIFVSFMGDYDASNANLSSASPECLVVIQKQVSNMKAFIRFIKFTTMNTIVTDSVTGNIFYIGFSHV